MLDKLQSASGLIGGIIGNKEHVAKITTFGVNRMSGLMDGCVIVPSRTEDVYIYFVIPNMNLNDYVCGYMMSEHDKIIQGLLSEYKYAIFCI